MVAAFQRNWRDDPASLWGLVIAVYVLIVAMGARRAAQEARSAERLRTALDAIEGAANKCTEVGQFVRLQKWDVVELRAQEVMTCCRATVAGWGDESSLKDSRNKLNQVATQMGSIVEQARNANVDQQAILTAQLKSVENLAVVIGKTHKNYGSGSR